jgi:predicted metal-dependent HD superfamily phosphohydrolase
MWKGFGVGGPPDSLFEDLIARYSESQRSYHTTQHLDECFARLGEARHLAEHIGEVELALWFHDAVYAPRKPDNEEQSASLAHAAAEQAGLTAAIASRVGQLILATKLDASPTSADAALLVDVDLAILGTPAERFDEYEQQVRQEYSWVPGFLYRRKRWEILEGFLARPHVFNTEHFRARYEMSARANLARSIERLGG